MSTAFAVFAAPQLHALSRTPGFWEAGLPGSRTQRAVVPQYVAHERLACPLRTGDVLERRPQGVRGLDAHRPPEPEHFAVGLVTTRRLLPHGVGAPVVQERRVGSTASHAADAHRKGDCLGQRHAGSLRGRARYD